MIIKVKVFLLICSKILLNIDCKTTCLTGLSIIIYLLLLLIIGFPVLLIETLVSQFSRKRPIELWDSLPLIGKGLALTQCIITIIQSIVYTFLTATALRILFNTIETLINSNQVFIFPWIKYDNECTALTNDSSNILELSFNECNCLFNNSFTCFKQPFSEMYLLNDIWQLTNFENSLNDWNIESFCWKFASFMCAIQVFIFLTTLRSVERIMRYISVIILTYSTLVFVGLLVIIGLQNEFSALKNYFITTFENGFEAMRESKNWLKILSHVVTSLYLAIGFVPHFGHRIDFKHTKTYRNNMIALTSNLLVFILLRLLSSISVFYNESFQTQKVHSIDHQIVLPFSIYVIICDALTFLSDNLNQTIVISLTIAFLLAIVLIGLQTIVLLRETTIGFFINREEDKSSKHLTVKIIVTLLLLSSLLLATNRGPTLVIILYTYGIVTPVIVCILLQLIILLWLYGIRRFQSDIHFMLDSVIPLPIRMSWILFTPIALIGIYVAFLIQTKFWTHISLIKVILISFILIPIPLSVIGKLTKAPAYTLKEVII